MKHIFKCNKCNKYTMKEICCNGPTLISVPLKYTILDKYGHYRIKIKLKEYISRGLLS